MGIVLCSFFFVGFIFLLLCLLLILRIGFVRLDSRIGRARDGFPPGTKLPYWRLPDLTGKIRGTPSKEHWQLLVLANYALGGFPELIELIESFHSTEKNLEIIILSAASKDFCEAMVRGLDLKVPVVAVDMDFYQHFRVNVMPFAFLIDASGIIRWVGVANPKTLKHTWELLQHVQVNTLTEVSR